MSAQGELLSIDELADRAGVSRRTVRFYVQRGLLPAPRGLGRGSHYDVTHLQVLLQVRAWQEEGVPLALIARRLQAGANEPGSQARGAGAGMHTGTEAQRDAGRPPPAEIGSATVWQHLELADGVVLQLRDRPLNERQRRDLARAVARILDRRGKDE